MKRKVLTIALLSLAFGMNAQENTKDVQEVILQGNRMDIPFSQAARDVQVITSEEIKKLPAKSLNELLTFVGGVDVKQRGPFGTQADISIDGGSFEQTLVLVNGMKMIDSQTAHNMMNLPITLDAIDHIEVLRGAAARVYGINALTGAINIVTKKTKNSFVAVDLFGGSSFKSKEEGDGSGIYTGGGVQVTGNLGTEKQSHLFSAGKTSSNGQRYNSAQEGHKFFYNGAYRFNENHSIQALAGYTKNHFGANGFYAAPSDRNSEEIVNTSMFSISSKHQFGNVTISPRISDRYNEDDYRFYKDNLGVARSRHYTNALMMELNGNMKTSIGQFGLGWETRLEKINSSNIGDRERDNHGAYAEFKTQLTDKLMANLGAYVNYNSDYGWKMYPGLDMAYMVDQHWKISASVGSGQRIPSFTDLYLDQKPGNVGNPFVQPENAWQYEANVNYTKGGFSAQTGYFFRDITDFIDWIRPDASVPYSPVNFGKNKIHGFYARVQHSFSLGENQRLGYRLSYNFLSPKIYGDDTNQSKYVLESLKHQFIAGLQYSIQDFSVQVENRWMKRELNKGYNVTDIRLNYQWKDFVVYSDITNIFEAQYRESGAVPMPGRWFSLGFRYLWQNNK
ncbi:TonB-dependent siderophore receptor [Elizabethkingia sp. JS20170427COW]|uniref:TonB-dependent receptor plug domain-containing protein n=1 Tax=Elizabethkingia sp. JS20170427COW TaxID=2583851 RepID=UPI001110BF44|nr:TonB-dependent receptor [Elizabethkingia sp. JS20170427COW]QCX52972.1 TonB-dependent receptor [Elizabethkingia sp. JS20170427COW]